MAEIEMPWFRYYSETTDDMKIFRIARETGLPKMSVLGAWSTLLCLANQSPRRGELYITLQKYLTVTDLSLSLDTDQPTTQALLDKFLEYEMIEIVDDAWVIRNWEKRQFTSDTSTPRVQKYRRKRIETFHDVSNSVSSKRSRNGPDTDPESDPEAEAEVEAAASSSPSASIYACRCEEGQSASDPTRQPSTSLTAIAAPAAADQPSPGCSISNQHSAISIPSNPAEASLNPIIQILLDATGAYPPQAEYKNTIDTILLLSKTHPDRADLVDYLKRFWIAWKGRKSKNGSAYKSGNMAWLYEWAVNGEIPPEYHPLPSADDKLARQQKALYGSLSPNEVGRGLG